MPENSETSCPLLRQSGYGAGFNPNSETTNCIKDKCEWWFGRYGCCSITAIANAISKFVDNRID